MTRQSVVGMIAASYLVLAAASDDATAQVVFASPVAVGTVASDLGNLFVYSESSVSVGRLSAELLDGFVEFDIRGLPTSGAGNLMFQILTGAGATGNFGISGYIYAGDGAITTRDFEIPLGTQLVSFAGGADGYTIDLGSYAYDLAQWGNYSFLGLRFQGARDQLGGPLPFLLRTLGAFALTIDPSVPLPPAVPVPEPQTYAMLLAGVVAVGAFAKRRRRA